MADIIDTAEIELIVEREVLSFDDVSRFDEATLTEIMLTVGRAGSGIKITVDEDEKLIVTLDIIVYYGVNIPQLCYDIQTRVKHTVENTFGVTVKAVNIKIEGIDKRVRNTDQEQK
jgi:uncharacterized alkaline shock family protein YloU